MLSIITPTCYQIKKLVKLEKALMKQRYREIEWILAIDGDPKTEEWALNRCIKHVYQRRDGRRYNEVCNKAAKEAHGDLLFINGDSVPSDNYYIDNLLEGYKHNRIVSGLRINMHRRKVYSTDHRLEWFKDIGEEPFKIELDNPWEKQTSNGMLVSHKLWDKLGGFDEAYKRYGVVDQDFCMRAYHIGIEQWLAPKAVLNHFDIKDKELNKDNWKLYEERKLQLGL